MKKFTFVLFFSISVFFILFISSFVRAQSLCNPQVAGDANCDAKTDLTDFEIWRKEFMGVISSTTADFNNDSIVSLPDFEIWRKAYTNKSTPSPTVTGGVTPTGITTNTPTPAGPTPTVPQTSGEGIVISPTALRALPIAGQANCASGTLCANAWNAIIAKAESNWGSPDIDTYDLPHEEGVLAAAIAYARLKSEPGKTAEAQKYYDKAVSGLMAVIGTEKESVPNADGSGGKDDGELAIARNLAEYVIASDMIGLYPDGNNGSSGTKWGNYVRYMYSQKFTFRVGDGGQSFSRHLPICASNGCAMGGATRIALASYLKDKAALDNSWIQFRRYTGDYNASSEFTFSGTGDTWYHDNSKKVAINPKGATCAGTSYPADGVIPNDQGRGGTCPSNTNTVPGYTQYPWEGMQGAYLMAFMLDHHGYRDAAGNGPFKVNDSALLRAIQYQWYLQNKFGGSWYDGSRAAWVKHLANMKYGFKPVSYNASGSGRNFDFTQWLVQ